MSKSLSIVLSVYNEEDVIDKSLQDLISYMTANHEDAAWEILVVDDGSVDRTNEIINEIAARESNVKPFHHDKNMGQGRGLRTGFENIRGDLIVTMDADLSYRPECIGELVKRMEESGADIVIASAMLPSSRIVGVSLYRKVLTKCANWFLSASCTLGLSAITCAVRVYRRGVIDMLSLNSDGIDMNLEAILKAQMLGFKVVEIPATLEWAQSSTAESRKGRRSLGDLFRTSFRYFFFGYLFNPNVLFLAPLIISSSVFVIYFISLVELLIRRFYENVGKTHLLAVVSDAMRWTFENYTHAYYFLVLSVAISLFLFIAWFLTKQSKFYFEQNYRLLSSMLSARRKRIEE